ncbi:cobalamin biosynthesis protein CbiX [Melaminivora suipulveris]|uniref:Cobalamin biosynthesis protein CbiX n=1 Tax=Melaminivora suipulveris TaxID=2109913 RepID=A0A2R3Q879_9BURK|nr:CbiX/SirB N-terminal domain-containing protein [Melaminivora suipulveris]AVO47874.1 cobalamin biosynthesis protein CbiX [Melaminivora suipulveris]
MAGSAVILLAHGSRDALWRRSVEAVQAQLRQTQPDVPVRCAYLELCAPTLAQAVRELAAEDAARIAIVPLFLGVGRHVREDLPQQVQALALEHPQLQLALSAPVGEDARLVALLAQLAGEAALGNL